MKIYKKKIYPSLLAGFSSRIACARQLPFTYSCWNLWCSNILWQQRADWHHHWGKSQSWLQVHRSRHCESLPVLLFNFKNSNENRRVNFGNGFICKTQKKKSFFLTEDVCTGCTWMKAALCWHSWTLSSDSLTAMAFPLIFHDCNQQIQWIYSDGLIWRAAGRGMTLYSGKSTGLTCRGY